MLPFADSVTWGVGGAIAALALFMLLHLFSRAFTRTRQQKQTAVDNAFLRLLQAGISADDFLAAARKPSRRYARRAVLHAFRSLGETFREFLTYTYDQLGFCAQAIRDCGSGSWTTRAEGVLELGAFRKGEAIPHALTLLNDTHVEVRIAAARALSDIGAPGTIRPILDAIPVCTRWAISDAVDLIRPFGESAGPELLQVLRDSTTLQARLAAVEAIGEIAYRDAFKVIEPLLGDQEVDLRAAATRALGRLGGHGLYPALGRALKDPAWQVRAVAARQLGSYRGPEAVALLEVALGDPAWWVRVNAAEALRLQEAQGADSFRKMSASPDKFASDLAAQMLEALEGRSIA